MYLYVGLSHTSVSSAEEAGRSMLVRKTFHRAIKLCWARPSLVRKESLGLLDTSAH